MPTTVREAVPSITVSIAPLILLSACDHYGRSGKGTRKRVVGVLLGQNTGSTVRVTNSFAGTGFSTLRTILFRWIRNDADACFQFRSRRMKRTPPCGFLTTTTSNR